MDEELLLTTAEVATFLGISVQAVYKARYRKTIKPLKRKVNVVYYSMSEVRRYQKESAGKVGYRHSHNEDRS